MFSEIHAVEAAVKEWLPSKGDISMQGTRKIIAFLTNKNKLHAKYATSQLGSYAQHFGWPIGVGNYFENWAIEFLGAEEYFTCLNLFASMEATIKDTPTEEGSVLEKIKNFCPEPNYSVNRTIARISGYRGLSGKTLMMLGHIPAPKTDEGISMLADEFNFEEDKLKEVLRWEQLQTDSSRKGTRQNSGKGFRPKV